MSSHRHSCRCGCGCNCNCGTTYCCTPMQTTCCNPCNPCSNMGYGNNLGCGFGNNWWLILLLLFGGSGGIGRGCGGFFW